MFLSTGFTILAVISAVTHVCVIWIASRPSGYYRYGKPVCLMTRKEFRTYFKRVRRRYYAYQKEPYMFLTWPVFLVLAFAFHPRLPELLA